MQPRSSAAASGGVEGALIGSLPSHQYVQVVDVVVLLGDPQRQHLLVEEESAQALLAGLPLLLQLPLAQRLLLQLPLLRSLLEGQREGRGGGRGGVRSESESADSETYDSFRGREMFLPASFSNTSC